MAKLHYVLFFLLQAAIIKSCAKTDRVILSEGANIEKSLLKEAEMASRFSTLEVKAVKEANESLKVLEKNEVLKSEFTKVKNEKTEKIKNIIDNIPDIETDDKSKNTSYENNSNKIYVDNIVNNGSFITISKIIKYNYASNKLNDADVKNLLEGRSIDTLKLAPQTLFNIYFKYSETFSEKVLIQMAISSNCNKEKLEQIKIIAKNKIVPANSELYKIIRKCDNL